jgi:putative ABC transport system permease protein
MDDVTRTRRFRFWRWLITFIGVIVPRRFRARFRQEWEAELEYREELLARWDRLDWGAKLKLLWRSFGAFWDALWLQQLRWEDEMIQDLRYGARMLIKYKGFTAAAVLTLALGIGANSAIFSVVNAVILRPLPYHEPDSLAILWTDDPKHEFHEAGTSYLNFADWRAQSKTFGDMAICSRGNPVIFAGADEQEQVMAEQVSANLFPLLGVNPLLGRAFSPDEEERGESVVVLSYGIWQRRFGADSDIIGKTLELRGAKFHSSPLFKVIGVMPANFYFPSKDTQLWLPTVPRGRQQRFNDLWRVIGRLKPNATFPQAQAEMTAIGQRLAQTYPTTDPGFVGFGVNVTPLLDQVIGRNLRLALWVLLGAVGFVLLIACANVANLLLARGAARAREFAIRAALGAGQLRLLRQLLTESVTLSMGAGLVGFGLAVAGVRVLAVAAPPGIPRLDEVRLDYRALLFTLGLSLLVGILFGLAPAWKMSRSNPSEDLKEGGGITAGGLRLRQARGLLVIAECALAVALLTGAGLLIRSFQRLQSVDPGFRPEGVLLARVTLPYQAQAQVIERLAGLPGVQAVGVIEDFLIRRTPSYSIVVEGRALNPAGSETGQLIDAYVSTGFFQAMGTPLLRGRFFSGQDVCRRTHTGCVNTSGVGAGVIINEALARRFFPDEDAVGKRFRLNTSPANAPDAWSTVLGVVGDMRRQGLEKQVVPQVYFPVNVWDFPSGMDVMARASSDPLALAATIRQTIRSIDKKATILSVNTLDAHLGKLSAQRRLNTWLLALFATLALSLAAIGIYGLMHFAVAQRTHEIGIRIALGARSSDVTRLVIGQGMKMVFVGVAVGLVASLWLTSLMAHLLFEVSGTDPVTYCGVALLLVSVALVACYLPARKAAQVDPLVALRHE